MSELTALIRETVTDHPHDTHQKIARLVAGQVVMWFQAVASPGWPVRAAVRCRRL